MLHQLELLIIQLKTTVIFIIVLIALKLKWSVLFTIRLLNCQTFEDVFQHIYYYVQVSLTNSSDQKT